MDDHHSPKGGSNSNNSNSDNNKSRSFEHQRRKSGGQRGGGGDGDDNENNNKWSCVSPMTRHIIRDSLHSPGDSTGSRTLPVLRRNRSRSFNDYIEKRAAVKEYERNDLYLPDSSTTPSSSNKFLNGSSDRYSYTITTTTTAAAAEGTTTAKSSLQSPLLHGDENNDYESSMVTKSPIPPPSSSSPNRSDRGSDSSSSIMSQTDEKQQHYTPPAIAIMYGLINATIVLPVIMSFGNIIYSDDAFAPYTPVLIKLTLISGVVHQICFCLFSTLSFVVGSVQDAGLIFLSSMASDMVVYCRSQGLDDDAMLATVTIGLGIATATLGFGLIVVGKLKLAGYVQMLPTCVIAGYLAFIGWFCGKSGVALMAGASELTFEILWQNIHFVIPGILGGIFIYLSVRTLKHVAVLPCCIILMLVLFYSGLVVFGSSIEQATDNGWIRKSEPAPIWYHTWDYLQFDKVQWGVLPQLLLTEISMIFVVALSSSLDVAAIELELKQPLNYNKELSMIGISNVVSGLTGGYTGSYIFSQSIFTLRSNVRSRLAGFALATCQFVVFVCPFPILSYIPNFFYGSLLGMICIDLVYEWLWEFRTKSKPAEYIIALCTFGVMQFIGVEYGILVGIAMYILCRYIGIDVGELKQVTITTDDEDEEDGSEIINNGSKVPPHTQETISEETDEEQIPLMNTSSSSPSTMMMNGGDGGQYNSLSTLIPPEQQQMQLEQQQQWLLSGQMMNNGGTLEHNSEGVTF